MRRAAATLLLLAAIWLPACNNVPTEITPLPRAVGEIEAIYVRVNQLQPLDPATEGVYVLWALTDRSRARRVSDFYISDDGSTTDASGNRIERFTSDEFALRKTISLLITIETNAEVTESPAGMQILSGTFIEGVASLTVPVASSIFNASGTLRVFTPTDGPDTNERSGVWGVTASGEPSLRLPITTAALQYETFIDVGGRSLPVGRFEAPDDADDANAYSSTLFAAPERPGEDLLLNAPEGLSFPVDLSGARVSISLEGRFNDFVQQSQLIVLEGYLPVGLQGGESVELFNLTASFPSGTAILY